MAFNIDEMLGEDDGKPKPRRPPRRDLGALHTVLTRGLPDLCDDNVCNLHKLASSLHLTYQAVYKWMRPNHRHQLPANQIERIVALSKNQTSGKRNFKPLEISDLWPFVSS